MASRFLSPVRVDDQSQIIATACIGKGPCFLAVLALCVVGALATGVVRALPDATAWVGFFIAGLVAVTVSDFDACREATFTAVACAAGRFLVLSLLARGITTTGIPVGSACNGVASTDVLSTFESAGVICDDAASICCTGRNDHNPSGDDLKTMKPMAPRMLTQISIPGNIPLIAPPAPRDSLSTFD